MTDAERLEWACSVLSREKWDDRISWVAWQTASGQMQVGTAGHGVDLSPFAAIAIALALDKQARRRLAPVDRAEWAAMQLSRLGHHEKRWAVSVRSGGTVVVAQDGEAMPWPDALAIAESLVRREMLGDTSDASPKGVKP